MDHTSRETDYTNRIETCRKADAEKESLYREILQTYEALKEAHKILQGEFNNERESRRMWMARCEDSEKAHITSEKAVQDAKKAADSGSFVVVILDGDGAIFQDHLYQSGKEGGGLAASQLESEVRAHLKTLHPEQSTSSWSVITYIFLNVQGLAGALYESGLLPGSLQAGAASQLAAFGHTFGNANALFNFVDVGNGKERADYKARETLRAFLPFQQCKHVFFGPCHDNGYLPVLEPLSHKPEFKKRITLVSTRPAERGFSALGFDIVDFPSVFRDTDLPGRSGFSRVALRRSSDSTTNGTNQDSLSLRPAVGTTSLSTDSRTATKAGASAPSSWSTVAGRTEDNHKIDISSQSNTKPSSFISLSVNGERLDPDLPHYPSKFMTKFEEKRRAAGKNFCNNYHLLGDCPYGSNCPHTHGQRLSTIEQDILRDKARGIICYSGSECRDFACYMGHQCKYGKHCKVPDCRMACFHYVNTVPYKRLYEDGREETLSGLRKK